MYYIQGTLVVFTHLMAKTNIEMKKLKFNSSLQDLYSKSFIYVITPLMVCTLT